MSEENQTPTFGQNLASAGAAAAQRLQTEPTTPPAPTEPETPPSPQPETTQTPTAQATQVPPVASAGEDLYDVRLSDGTVEKVKREHALELSAWAIETLRRAHEAAEAQRQEQHQTQEMQPQQRTVDPVQARLDRLERTLSAREMREQQKDLIAEIHDGISKSPVFKGFAGEEREHLLGLVAAGIASGPGITTAKAVQRLEKVFGQMTGKDRAAYVEEKLEQAASRPLPRAAAAATPARKPTRADLHNGVAQQSAINRLKRATVNT